MKKSTKWILLGLVIFYFFFSWMFYTNDRCKRAYEEFPIFTIFCPSEEEVQASWSWDN